MRRRQELVITQVAALMTSSSDLAMSLIEERRQEQEDEKTGKGLNIPWPLFLAAGASIAGVLSLMSETESELVPQSETSEASEEETTEPVVADKEDDGQSLLDKVVDWLRSIPEAVGLTGPKVVPTSPVVGQSVFVGPPAPESKTSTVNYLRVASSATGVDLGLIYPVVKLESGLNVNAQNKLTNATGLFQFLPSTWAWLIKKYPALKFTQADIRDPQKNAIMGALYLKQISDALTSHLGRTPTPTEVYLGHFLGTTGAIRFLTLLKNSPNETAASYFKSAAKTNSAVFYDQGKARTFAEVWSYLNGRITNARAEYIAMSVENVPLLPQSSTSNVSMATPVPDAPPTLSSPSTVATLNTKIKQRESIGLQVAVDNTPSFDQPEIVTTSSQPPQQKTYAKTRRGVPVAIPLE